jgi:hypothetical protein
MFFKEMPKMGISSFGSFKKYKYWEIFTFFSLPNVTNRRAGWRHKATMI